MARKSAKTVAAKADAKAEKSQDIIDAEIVEETATEPDTEKTLEPEIAKEAEPQPEADKDKSEEKPADTASEEQGSDEKTAVAADGDTPIEMSEPDVEAKTEDAPKADAETAVEPPAPAAAVPAPVVVKRTGFVPIFLGGVAAAAIGFGASAVLFPEGLNPSTAPSSFDTENAAQIKAQAAEIAALKSAQAGAPSDQELASVVAPLQGQLDEIKTTLSRLEATVGGFDARITDLEKRPLTDAISPAAIQAYEREVKALQEAVAAQRAEAAEMEDNARESARTALAQSAMTRIVSALDSGAPFRAALVDLTSATGVAAPAALDVFADNGAPTRAALIESFPDAARAALNAARSANSGSDGGSRLSTFLKNQLGARSVSPKEGDDPDAILSRAEAALREGRLADALVELDTLPAGALAEMKSWIAVAQSRADAVSAAQSLAKSLNSK